MNRAGPQKPTHEVVGKYVRLFEEDDWSIVTDKALDLLFRAFPRNCRIEAVYLKVTALNDLYATQLSPLSIVTDRSRHRSFLHRE